MKKLKNQYRNTVIQQLGNRHWTDYSGLRNGPFKCFSTKQEKSFFYLHQIECKDYPIKLRAARGKSLADPWDDYPSYVYYAAKSWKHNSKRRKQYY